jgi:hypothetical protein
VSRARAAGERIPLDSYQTPQPLALGICATLRKRGATPAEIVEPSGGSGVFVAAARLVWPDAHVTANDVDRGRRRDLLQAGAHLVLHEDWTALARRLASEQPAEGPERLIVGNPPFRLAERHVEAGLEWLRDGDRLAFLLRLNLLGSTRRLSFWARPGLASVAPIVPRPSFTGTGTDGTEYAVFTWVKGYRGAARLQRPIVWKPARRVA